MPRTAKAKKILPCSLFVDGRPCLVVGGGRIGARKAGHLLDAGAEVTVVAPDVGPRLEELATSGHVRLVRRGFTESDLNDMVVVFAATDDDTVNRHVVAACRTKGILVSSAGANWPEGDLVTPAILRKNGLVLTVATGGESCGRARRVKDTLARHIDLLTNDEKTQGTL